MKKRTENSANYAVQIQPRNGQQLAEVADLSIVAREWTGADRRRYPQAERTLWDGAKLVVHATTGEVYAVEA